MTAIFNNGVYDFAEAARFTGLKRSRVREWFRIRNADPTRRAMFVSSYAPVDGKIAISFLDMIDVFVAGQLRDHGVTLQHLRKVYKSMRVGLNTDHPFSHRELLSDGKKVFMRWEDEEGRHLLEEALTRQRAFPEMLLPFLKRIDYDEASRLAKRWRIAEQVVLDPTICFGQPIVEPVGIPTALLASVYTANDDNAAAVAEWYNVEEVHVMAAVKFERGLAA